MIIAGKLQCILKFDTCEKQCIMQYFEVICNGKINTKKVYVDELSYSKNDTYGINWLLNIDWNDE